MARVRIPDEMRDTVKKYVRDHSEYDTQSELVKDAIRRLLDQKSNDKVQLDDKLKSELKKDIIDELDL